MAVKQTAGRETLGEFAPKFAELNDDVLFGQVWSREDKLSLRERSIVTVVALMAQGLTDSSFQYHLTTAKNNGVTKTEIAEILTHAAFYAGWSKAWAAFRMAKEVWAEDDAADAKAEHQNEMVFPIGAPNDAFAKYFIGQSYLAPLSTQQIGIYNVTFEPGCRKLAHSSRQKRRRTDPRLCGWSRLLSGMGQTGTGAAHRRCGKHSDRGQALARCCTGQLVLSSGGRGSGRRNLQ